MAARTSRLLAGGKRWSAFVAAFALIAALFSLGIRAEPSTAGSVSSTAFPTANEVVTTGWTNPGNAHASGDTAYATAAPGKNLTVDSRWKTFGFDSAIPSAATITSVVIIVNFDVDTTSSIATLQAQATVSGTEYPTSALTNTSEPTSYGEVSFDITSAKSWTRSDLLDANFKAHVGALRGNSNTAVNFSMDYVKVQVGYTMPSLMSQSSYRWFQNSNPSAFGTSGVVS